MEIINDFSTSVEKSLSEIDPNWKEYEGLIVCGTHSPHDVEIMIDKIREYREAMKPYLGICFGHQLAAIEYARNVLGIKDATSQEFDNSNDSFSINPKEFIVIKRPDGLKVGLHDGESWWNNYEVKSSFNNVWKKADNFITVQYHPEYNSSIDSPHKVLVDFLKRAKSYAS